MRLFKTIGGGKERCFCGQRTLQSAQKEMQFRRADRPADSVDCVLVFRPHSDLLAKMSVYCTGQADFLDGRFARLASKPARTPVKVNNNHKSTAIYLRDLEILPIIIVWRRNLKKYQHLDNANLNLSFQQNIPAVDSPYTIPPTRFYYFALFY